MVYGVWENTNLCRRNTQFVSITYLICESWKTCTLSMLSAHRNFPAKVKTSKVFNIKCAPWWSFQTHSHTHTLHFNVWINASHTIVYDQHGQFFFCVRIQHHTTCGVDRSSRRDLYLAGCCKSIYFEIGDRILAQTNIKTLEKPWEKRTVWVCVSVL